MDDVERIARKVLGLPFRAMAIVILGFGAAIFYIGEKIDGDYI